MMDSLIPTAPALQRVMTNVLSIVGHLHPAWQELFAYVGLPNVRWDWLHSGDGKVVEERQCYPDSVTFYRETDVYLYHLMAYWLDGWKRPYQSLLLRGTGQKGHLSILDYGCGIGSDGLFFLENGFDVSFADVQSHSLDFLRWRLAHRGYPRTIPVYIFDDLPLIPVHHFVWCMDVLEHCPPDEHVPLLERLATLGQWVCINLVQDSDADGLVHYAVDVDHLTAYVMTRWGCQVDDFYQQNTGGKVRVLVYGTGMEPGTLPC